MAIIADFIRDFWVEILGIIGVVAFWGVLFWAYTTQTPVDTTPQRASQPAQNDNPKQVCKKKLLTLTDTWECTEE